MIRGVPYDAEIEYLESTGTQYIDTGIVKDTAVRLTASILWKDVETKQLMGSDGGFYFGVIGSYWQNGQKGSGNSGVPVQSNTWYNVALSWNEGTTLTVDGNSFTYPRTWSSDNYNVCIFAIGSLSSPLFYCNCRIRGCQMFLGNILVRDFIPVRVGSGANAVGYMYDRVTRKLFGNAGTGAFTRGPDVATPVMSLHRFTPVIRARDYVQDGLLAMWDAEWNVGDGMHDPAAMTWKNLAGDNGLDMISNGTPVFYSNYIQPTKVSEMFHTNETSLMDGVMQDGKVTMEIVGECVIPYTRPHMCIFGGGNFSAIGIYTTFTCPDVSRVGVQARLGSVIKASYGGGPEQNVFGYVSLVSDGVTMTAAYRSLSGSRQADASVSAPLPSVASKRFCIGYRYTYSADNPMTHGEKVYTVRVYTHALTGQELAHNRELDRLRFNVMSYGGNS